MMELKLGLNDSIVSHDRINNIVEGINSHNYGFKISEHMEINRFLCALPDEPNRELFNYDKFLKIRDPTTNISCLELVKMVEAWQVTCSRFQYKGKQEAVFRVGKEKNLILPANNSFKAWDAPFARETINQKKIAISGTNVKEAVIIVIMKRNVLLGTRSAINVIK
ncbi:hypothetical protein Zmor_004505 [Zophobas morio]|uniref:Uncharacterized protein n=1 Tax=Zophobas morio TaxID=2755281 RepID=A0AA38LZC8_9CUCU|nr:hypothetical protein Zmor_004505 [Zophobas morio]